MRKSFLTALFLIALGLAVGAAFVTGDPGSSTAVAQSNDVKLGADRKAAPVPPELQAFNDALVRVSKQETPCVVSIVVTTKPRRPRMNDYFHFFRMPQERQQGSGSGVIVTQDGYILTNNHVVEDADEKGIEVKLEDTRRYKARLIGTDPLTDIAVIKIDETHLPVAMLGNSDDVQVGQWVLAIGNPLGLTSTVTGGIVSYLGRRIDIIADRYGVENFIQTDAAINPGNSGGALINIRGEVIGINTAIATNSSTYEGYGFAIPINLAKTVAEDLIRHGKVQRGYIGVQIQPVDETVAKATGLPKAEGALVADLVKGGAAQDAGIRVGDIIMSVDDKTIKQTNDLQAYVAGKHPGDEVRLQLWRDGRVVERSVRLKEAERDEALADNADDEGDDAGSADNEAARTVHFDRLGFSVTKADAQTMRNRKTDSEILVAQVKPYTEASERQLVANDIIVEADMKGVTRIADLEKIVHSKKPGDALMLRVKGIRGDTRYVAVLIPKD